MNRSILLAAVLVSGAILVNGFLERRAHLPRPASSSTAPAAPNQTIVVLPFTSSTSDEPGKSFAEGVRNEIITRLATQHIRASEAEEAPGTGALLRGSVQRAGDRVRVNVQLVDAISRTARWAESYDRQVSDVFAIESAIADAVAKSIAAQQKS